MLTMEIRIGFGRYQQQLFVLSGLGWLADSESLSPSNFGCPYLGPIGPVPRRIASHTSKILPEPGSMLINISRSLVSGCSPCSSSSAAGIEPVSD